MPQEEPLGPAFADSTSAVAECGRERLATPISHERLLVNPPTGCEIDREQIVLRGTLPSYYLKQVPQSMADKVVGVERLHSDIEVENEEEMVPPELNNPKQAETVLAK